MKAAEPADDEDMAVVQLLAKCYECRYYLCSGVRVQGLGFINSEISVGESGLRVLGAQGFRI